MPTSKSSKKKGKSPEETLDRDSPRLTVPVMPERDHIQGSIKAPVTLVEYGDYQCPYCGAAHPEVKKVQKQLESKLRFVFRNFPITSSHEFAERSAEMAEASAAQGRFWEMHDFLYEHQNLLSDYDSIFDYAGKIGLDLRRFGEEVKKSVYFNRIKEDFDGGIRSGVNGTPTFYVNGARYNGSPDARDLVEALTSN